MFRYEKISPKLFVKNREKISGMLKPGSIAIVHSNKKIARNGDQEFFYRQNSDMLYLTGIPQEETILVMFPDCPEKRKKEMLFIKKNNKKTIIWEGEKLNKSDAKNISGVKSIYWLHELEEILSLLIKKADFIFFDKTSDFILFNQLKELVPQHKHKDLLPLIRKCRIKKEPEEIALMQKAANITSEAFCNVLQITKPKIKEFQIEAVITHNFIDKGANGHAYHPIVASGLNNCFLHYTQNSKRCKKEELLLLDFGAEYAYYAADLSRTIPVSGNFSKRQLKVYNAVLSVLNEIKKHYVPGKTIEYLNILTSKLIEEQCVKLNLLSKKSYRKRDLLKNYFMHGVAHFIGLDVHDCGSKQTVLEEGMVLSCEPAIYIKKEGFGIRLENDIVIGKKPIDLFEKTPINPNEIEYLMNKKTI